MHIERAYCVELATIVDIYAARDHYFRQAPPRKRFEFLCSDEQCRATKGTKVTGVNYDKLVEETDQYVRPHFRENTEHTPTCEWVELEIALHELKGERGTRGRDDGGNDEAHGIGRGRKTSNVVDIFIPSSDATAKVTGRIPAETRSQVKRIPAQRGRVDAIKNHLRENPNQTCVLEEVVDSYLSLTQDERRTARLRIGAGRQRSYRECFRPLSRYEQGAGDEFVYYGGARAKRIGPNFSLRFYDQVRFGSEDRLISLYIQKAELDRYRHRAYLLEFLEKLVGGDARYATCYFYGRIVPSARNDAFLDVKLDHLGNLVLRLK